MLIQMVGRKMAYKIANIATVGCTVAVGTGWLAVHHFFLDEYKNMYQLYSSNGKPVEISPNIIDTIEEVLTEAKIARRKKLSCNFFVTSSRDMFHAGQAESYTGPMIGIPVHFKYENIDELNTSKIKFHKNMKIDWTSSAGQRLKESLILSKLAKKYAIAREVYFVDSHYMHMKCLASIVVCISSLLFGPKLIDVNNLRQDPRRYFVYILTLAMGVCMYFTAIDVIQNNYDTKAEERTLTTKYPDYHEGGLEYYQKIMERNKALRELLGKEGEDYCTESGDIITTMRKKYLTYSERIALIKDSKKEMESKVKIERENKTESINESKNGFA